MIQPVLSLSGVHKHYPVRGGGAGVLRAVDGVDLEVCQGETLAIVGESGCGKSTLARLMIRLIGPSAGRIAFAGCDITELGEGELRALRRDLQMVFQDPFSSLNPRMTVAELIGEPIRIHKVVPRRQTAARVAELMAMVGLDPRNAGRFPHEFSGGQRQRIGIARALASGPRLLVGDEPVSALDVSIQAQIINLLQELKRSLDLTLVVISHDLAVVRHLADRIAVMYLGRIVECAPRDRLFSAPLHPYTQALLSAVPVPRTGARTKAAPLAGELGSPLDLPAGCRFHPRCPHAVELCRREDPALHPPAGGSAADGVAACHFAGEIPLPPRLEALLHGVGDPPYAAKVALFQQAARQQQAAAP